MKGAGLFILFSSLWNGGFGLIDTTDTWTTPEGASSQENIASATVSQNKMLPTPQSTSAEISTIPEARTSEESLLKSTLPPSETGTPPEAMRSQTLTSTGKTEGLLKLQTLGLPVNPSLQLNPRADSVVLTNSTLKFLQTFVRKSNQQAIAPNSIEGSMGNRSPRETYLSRGDSSGSQKTNSQKSSFETTRGK